MSSPPSQRPNEDEVKAARRLCPKGHPMRVELK